MKLIRHVINEVHHYKRLKIEMDIVNAKLGDTYPEVSIVINYLRNCDFNTDKLIKDLEEHNGRIQSKDNSNNT